MQSVSFDCVSESSVHPLKTIGDTIKTARKCEQYFLEFFFKCCYHVAMGISVNSFIYGDITRTQPINLVAMAIVSGNSVEVLTTPHPTFCHEATPDLISIPSLVFSLGF